MTASWLNQLRWFAIAAQASTIAIVSLAMSVELPMCALGAILAVECAFAALCTFWVRRGRLQSATSIGASMLVDIASLTALLYFTGGPENPFSFLYLVHVTLALVAVGERAAWSLLVVSSALFGALFFYNVPLHVDSAHAHHAHHASHEAMSMHMQGMWVGFVVAAVFILVFSSRLSRAVASRDRELDAARERARASERLAGLATLAAGAAHELNTPLSTIALVARELEHEAKALDGADALIEDARLIRTEIERCRSILDQLSLDAGAAAGSGTEVHTVAEVLVHSPHAGSPRVIQQVDDVVRALTLTAPLRSLTTALDAAIDNALRASEHDVTLRVVHDGGDVVFEVRDRGDGMSEDTLARALDPFFTTRSDGMGLGLFLARTVADALGGALSLQSSEGEGTTATLRIPRGLT